jgi:hypothetical protein
MARNSRECDRISVLSGLGSIRQGLGFSAAADPAGCRSRVEQALRCPSFLCHAVSARRIVAALPLEQQPHGDIRRPEKPRVRISHS